MKNWICFGAWDGHPAEVMPNNDLKEHHDYEDCWCKPLFDENILVHNAMDGREKYERGERKVS